MRNGPPPGSIQWYEEEIARLESQNSSAGFVFSLIFGGLICFCLFGCQQPLPPSPTPIYVGLSSQLRSSLVKKHVAVVALAKSLEAVTDDATMRLKWNTKFKALEDTWAAESSVALKAAFNSATSPEDRVALWKEVQKAYAP